VELGGGEADIMASRKDTEDIWREQKTTRRFIQSERGGGLL
jgi:hypothetical protein